MEHRLQRIRIQAPIQALPQPFASHQSAPSRLLRLRLLRHLHLQLTRRCGANTASVAFELWHLTRCILHLQHRYTPLCSYSVSTNYLDRNSLRTRFFAGASFIASRFTRKQQLQWLRFNVLAKRTGIRRSLLSTIAFQYVIIL